MSDIKNCLNLENILFSPDLAKDHKLFAILRPMLEGALPIRQNNESTPSILWDESRYGLHQSRFYGQLSAEQKQRALERLTSLNLSLSYWIEKSGLHYGAKMVLLSQATETKVAYSMFVGEEAVHLEGFKRFMNFKPDWETHRHPMLGVLAQSIQQGSANALTFVIQVLLEGFGIAHYTGLRETCLHSELRDLFSKILKDEARHHGMGVVLCQNETFGREDQDQIFELTRDFIRSLQGAHWIKKAVEQVSEPMTRAQEEQFWADLRFDQVLKGRNQRLKEMIEKVGYHELSQRLQAEKVLY